MQKSCEKMCAFSKDGHCRYKSHVMQKPKDVFISDKNEKCPFFISISLKGLLP